ncbi:hypothetical protein CRD17_01335 [Corynebacterium sp. LK30]|uniref:ATP-binding protein n=1 Tax=Corynebacterium sp. LK30 TaxID=2044577 RepID=UPI001651CF85|nr:hypothetical protein [Corynebacterium sp. LK30]MBC6805860.1 hypothetical protein [Corynebacterium sp. LK30]
MKTQNDGAEVAGEILGKILEGVLRGMVMLWPTLTALTLLIWGWGLDTWLDWVKCAGAGVVMWGLWPTQKTQIAKTRVEITVERLLARQSPWAAETPAVRVRPGEARGTWQVSVRTPKGSTDETVASYAPNLEARLGAHLVQAVPSSAGSRSGVVDFDISMQDNVLKSTINEGSIGVRPSGLVTEKGWRLPLGVTTMGTTRMATLWTPAQGANRILITGNSGTGKSSASLRIVRSAIDAGLKTYIYDPSASSVRGWSQECNAFAGTPHEFLDLMSEVEAEFERRERLIAAGRQAEIKPGLVLIEEAAALLNDAVFARGGELQKQKASVEAFFHNLAMKVRKTGLVFVLSLQDSAGQSLGGTEVREQFNVRVCFPLAEAKARLLLSDEGAHMCASLAPLPPGIAVLYDTSSTAEDSRPHAIRFPAIEAPPVQEENLAAQEWSPWEESARRKEGIVEEAEAILRTSQRPNSKVDKGGKK